jgi:hypothetical protein
MRLNVLAGTYASGASNLAFAAVGTTTAPIWWRGYKTAIGDQDNNNVAVPGTDTPLLTFTTGQATAVGAHKIFSNLAFSGACVTAGGQFFLSGSLQALYRVRCENTAANANARACSGTGIAFTAIGCYFTCTSSAICVAVANYGEAIGCVFVGGSQNLNSTGAGNLKFNLTNCLLRASAGDAINTTQAMLINGCSIYAPAGHGINITTPPLTGGFLVANTHFENVNQATKFAITNSSGTNTNVVRRLSNTYFNCTGYENGFGDSPAIFDGGLLAGSGFANAAGGDFSASSLLKAAGFPGLLENTSAFRGYLDIGAVQRQEAAGGPTIIGGGEF